MKQTFAIGIGGAAGQGIATPGDGAGAHKNTTYEGNSPCFGWKLSTGVSRRFLGWRSSPGGRKRATCGWISAP
jgi:hypothetical protein